ncbi:hypothetical protein CMO91_01350, partial [Candidatus Woesearchaeota archaeon]|nr:hypothetical protein [Candidatus Woesearchaeota archaeon]
SYIVTTDPKDFAVLQLSSQEGPFTISLHAVQDERGVTTSSVGYQTLHYYTLRTLFGGCKSKFLEIAAEDPTQHSHLVRLISAAEKEIASRLPTKM